MALVLCGYPKRQQAFDAKGFTLNSPSRWPDSRFFPAIAGQQDLVGLAGRGLKAGNSKTVPGSVSVRRIVPRHDLQQTGGDLGKNKPAVIVGSSAEGGPFQL